MKVSGATLRKGGPHLGLCVMYPAPGIVERIGADWDWMWIDCQHGELGYQDMLAMVRACDLVQRPALVRVRSHEAGMIGAVLDTGASGVIVPLVDTAPQAHALVQAAKFPPLGARSYGGRRLIDRYGRLYAERANHDTLLVVQIETPESLENVDAIAAVPGVDALFYGPDDLMLRTGGKMNEARARSATEKEIALVVSAAHKYGKLAVNVGFGAEMLGLSVANGYNLVVGGGDSAFIANGSKQSSEQARNLVAKRNGDSSHASLVHGALKSI